MKTTKKCFAGLLVLMLLLLAISTSAFAATVTVPAGDAHTYVAYQIFTGTQANPDSESELGNIVWGNGINDETFLTALKAETGAFSYDNGAIANVFADCETAVQVAEELGKFNDNSPAAERFAKLALANKVGNGIPLTAGTQEIADGYYLIVDTTAVEGQYDVANPALLQMTGIINIQSKTDKPRVDKQVWDELADAETGHDQGWGETADHELNEIFQFKLIATLPGDTQFDRYATYEVKFTDQWSEGVTYDGNVSVVVDTVTLTVTQYALNVDTENRTMTIDIPDIKVLGVELSDGAVITVTYDAHLNHNAIVTTATTIANETADDNQNMVYLEYSNKPDATGLGKTPEDYVYVFTYETDSTKFDGEPNEGRSNVLQGAGFMLYKMNGEAKSWAILENNKIQSWTATEADATEVTSEADGKFRFIGLDAGEYYLHESTTPSGYNTCEDIKVTVSATHVENENMISATVKKDAETADPTVYNDVINKKGTELPETGGIGTTIFYIAGGLLMAAAVVFLIVRKKMAAFEK